jgi:hypothetical protein
MPNVIPRVLMSLKFRGLFEFCGVFTFGKKGVKNMAKSG